MYSKKGSVYKLPAGWFINHSPAEFINCDLLVKFKGLLCGILQKEGKVKTKFLAARQFINPTQAPSLSAASEGLQEKKNTIHQIFTLSNLVSVLGILREMPAKKFYWSVFR